RLSSIPPGAAALLVVRFESARHVVVHHEAHVGLVDPHPERIRGHDDASLSRHEGVLDALPLRVAQTSMVAHRGYPDPAQQGGERVDALSRRGVDDRGAAAVLKREAEAALAPLEEAEQEAVLLRVV